MGRSNNNASSEGDGRSCNEVAMRVGETEVLAPDDLVRQVGLDIRHARVLAILVLIEFIVERLVSLSRSMRRG